MNRKPVLDLCPSVCHFIWSKVVNACISKGSFKGIILSSGRFAILC